MATDFDLVVIGSGPAGEKGAVAAAYFGKKVAVVETGGLGGICVHSGTLPSKSMRESALHLAGLKMRGIAGLCGTPTGQVRVADLMAHKEAVCRAEEEKIRRNIDRHKVELIEGFGSIEDAHTVRVRSANGAERRLSCEYILLATGTKPHRPPGIPFDTKEVYDSDEILDLDFVPHSLIVLGGGVIGSEYASIFAALGVKVTLVEPRERMLGFLDTEVSDHLIEAFTALGIDLRFGRKAEGVRVIGTDDAVMTLQGGEEIRAEKVLVAAGRQGRVEGLGLEAVGIEPDKRGMLKVDTHFRTSCPSVFAVGDLIGFPALASTGMDQGRIAVYHAFQLAKKDALARHLPIGVYTIPEVATVGETEQEARARGEDVETGRALLRDNARSRINGAATGLVKLVFRAADRRLLGVHILGEQATETVHIGMMALQAGLGFDTFVDAVFNFPTLSEAYKYAAFDGLGRMAKRTVTTS